MRVQELPPGRVGVPPGRRRDPQRLEDSADRGCADPVTELEQLALDPLVSPAVVLGGEPPDEPSDLGADRRSSYVARIGPFLATSRRCHRRTVPGVTSQCARSFAGRYRISAAMTARSAQSSRGLGLVRRSTATSCRSTSRPSCPTAAHYLSPQVTGTGRILALDRQGVVAVFQAGYSIRCQAATMMNGPGPTHRPAALCLLRPRTGTDSGDSA